MYNIIQLSDMDLSELQSIAKELGIQNADTLKKDLLVYSILDEQAIANASKEQGKEKEPRKRSRISVKKEGSKVYTATKDKAQKLEANSPEVTPSAPAAEEKAAPVENAKEENTLATSVEEPSAPAEEKPHIHKKPHLNEHPIGEKPKPADKAAESAESEPNTESVQEKILAD